MKKITDIDEELKKNLIDIFTEALEEDSELIYAIDEAIRDSSNKRTSLSFSAILKLDEKQKELKIDNPKLSIQKPYVIKPIPGTVSLNDHPELPLDGEPEEAE